MEETTPLLLNHLLLTGKLHTYLADLNEQAQSRFCFMTKQASLERVDFSREQCP